MDYIGWLAVHIAYNDITTSGIPSRWILTLVIVSNEGDEELLRDITSYIDQAARTLGVAIIGGHSGYTSGITCPMVSVTALGTACSRTPVMTTGAQPGDHTLDSNRIALEVTDILASDFTDEALKRELDTDDIEEAKDLLEWISVVQEVLLLALMGATPGKAHPKKILLTLKFLRKSA